MDFDSFTEFYDDFPSYVSPEYNVDELDEILRSTDANLSSGLRYSFQTATNFETFPSPPASSNSNSNSENIKSECDSPTDFNPDDFINFSSDEDAESKSIKSENRSTPSPTNSSTSTVSGESLGQSMMVDISSISPPTNLIQLPTNILPLVTNQTPINLFQGTLIPVKTVPLTTVQLQNFKTPLKISPKPPDRKPKTIVLSSKDFKAMMQTIQNGKSHGTTMPKLIMKSSTAPSLQKQLSVLPKVLPGDVVKSEQRARNLRLLKGVVDERHLKKQQRMIKNRESASLSRKKKKDYVVSLESRINDLENENITLKGENTSLRSQLVAFSQSCQCSHNKLSEFITNKFNSNLKSSNFKNRLLSSNMKKNTAVLLAMVFMLSINFGNFQTYFSQDDGFQSSSVDYDAGFSKVSGRRGLLWVDETTNWATSTDSIKVEGNHTTDGDEKCPISINQTENLRLASELRKWINVNDYLNLSTIKEKPFKLKLTPDYFELKSILPVHTIGAKNEHKRNRRNLLDRQSSRSKKLQVHPKSSLKIFGPHTNEEYLRLFEGINRRDDTFYVLSFNSDHILLPAAAYNKSTRPRMSLMLPAGDPSINGDITLMQIDCEVVNTTEVQLKPDMIPLNLRSKYNMNTPSSPDILNKTGGGPVHKPLHNAIQNAIESKEKRNQLDRYNFLTPYAAERIAEKNSLQDTEKRQDANSGTMATIQRSIRDDDKYSLHHVRARYRP